MKRILSLLTALAALSVCLCVAPSAFAEQDARAALTEAFISLYNAYITVETPPDGTPVHVVTSGEGNAVALEDAPGLLFFSLRFDGARLSGITITSPILDFPAGVAPCLVSSAVRLAGVNPYDVDEAFLHGLDVIVNASECSQFYESETVVFDGAVTLKASMLPGPKIIQIDFGYTPALTQP